MSNYKAITGSSKIVHRNQGGGSKLQGIASSTNLNTTAHVAFRNRNVVCPCKRNYIFCMNQLGGVGAGGIPGRSYAFAPGADGTHKPFYCGHPFGFKYNNNKYIIYPKKDKTSNTIIYNLPKLFSINLGYISWGSSNLVTNLHLLEGKSYSINTVNNLVVNFTIIKLGGKTNDNYYYIISHVKANQNVRVIQVYKKNIKINTNNVVAIHKLTATNFTISVLE